MLSDALLTRKTVTGVGTRGAPLAVRKGWATPRCRAPRPRLWAALVIAAWPVGCFLTRTATSGLFVSLDSTGWASDAIKLLPHLVVFSVMVFAGAPRKVLPEEAYRMLGHPLMVAVVGTQFVSSMLGDAPVKSLAFVLSLLAVLLTARLSLRVCTEEEIRRGLGWASLSLAASVLGTLVAFPAETLRTLAAEFCAFNAAGLGREAALSGMLAMAIRPAALRWAILGAMTLAIVQLESRTSLASLWGAILVVWYLPSLKRTGVVAALVTAIGLAMAVSPSVRDRAWEACERVTLWHDEARGYGSGATGRWERWAMAWHACWERPLWGRGPRTHASEALDAGWSAHSGYLVTVLENGILGATVVFAFMARELYQGLAAPRKSALARVLVASLVALAVRAVFESEFLNAVTPLTCVVALAMQDRHCRACDKGDCGKAYPRADMRFSGKGP